MYKNLSWHRKLEDIVNIQGIERIAMNIWPNSEIK